jgi:hypothetical protein
MTPGELLVYTESEIDRYGLGDTRPCGYILYAYSNSNEELHGVHIMDGLRGYFCETVDDVDEVIYRVHLRVNEGC